ncbi:hypothetical protein [Brevibacterium zhoupengii]|uniref:hypothetical protein n=1 Tax=Brevibacterium zhoupengii TaxID=2898795 RepID=UPI001E3230E8|nr:hypothetical protein [Brevibacterium zhoupengii]
MTAITINNRQLTIIFPGWERLMAGRRFHSVPLSAIHSTHVGERTHEFLGFRSGLAMPGIRTLGTFRHPDGTRRLVSLKHDEPVLHIRFHNTELGRGFDELRISTPDAAEVESVLSR